MTDPLGQIYLRARYYDPGLGVFTSLDPVEGVMGRSASWNGYGYVEGNPTTYTDPSGRCVGPLALVCLGAAIIGGAFTGGFVYGAASQLANNDKWSHGDYGGALVDAAGQGLAWGTGSAFVAGMAYAPVALTAGAAALSPIAAGAAWGGWYSTARWTLAAGGLGSAEDRAWAAATNPLEYIVGSALFGAAAGGVFGQMAAIHPLTTVRVGLGVAGLGAASSGLSIAQHGLNAVNGLDLGLSLFGMYQSAQAERALTACSFSADTQVATDEGEKPISQVRVGDDVLAYDEKTGTTGNYTVGAVFKHPDPVVVYVMLDGERIETTPEHPFFTRERGWVAAGELKVGEHVRKADGSYGVVEKIEVEQRQQTMYNLTVDQAHTFFVGKGQWLVHNMCPDIIQNPLPGFERPGLEPGEGNSGGYGKLVYNNGKYGYDTVEAHHIPADAYMKEQNALASAVSYTRNRGTAINMSESMHKLTATWSEMPSSYASLTPRQALAHDIWEIRGIYRMYGGYGSQIRLGLISAIERNKEIFETLFK